MLNISNKTIIGHLGENENKTTLRLTDDQIKKLLSGKAEITMTCVMTIQNNEEKEIKKETELPITEDIKKQIMTQIAEKKPVGRPRKSEEEKKNTKRAYDIKYQKNRYNTDLEFKKKQINKALQNYHNKKIGISHINHNN